MNINIANKKTFTSGGRMNINIQNSVTIKDVAKEAKVSIATVSRILNGKEGVSPVLIKRVNQAINDLGYQPNAVARALKVSKSKSIGLVIPDIENPFFPALVRGVEDAAQLHNYAVILCNTDSNPEKEKKYIEFLFSKRVDGILFTGGPKSGMLMEMLSKLPIPVVLLDRRFEEAKVSAVYTDNIAGMFLATKHLIENGCRHIVFISGPQNLLPSGDRLKGYLQAINASKMSPTVLFADFTFEGGFKAADSLINSRENFDGVVCANDLIAIGVIEKLLQKGYKIPDDVKVTGYDNIRLSEWYKPALTTVNQPIYEMGQQAIKMLVGQLHGYIPGYQEKILTPNLVIRSSSRVGG